MFNSKLLLLHLYYFSGGAVAWPVVSALVPGASGLGSSPGQLGWKTSAHVRDFMARAGANGLGTITNLGKMAIEIPVHERL